MSKIFITGDTHMSSELFGKFSSKSFLEGKELSKNDYVIVLGDFGAVTWDKSKETMYNID